MSQITSTILEKVQVLSMSDTNVRYYNVVREIEQIVTTIDPDKKILPFTNEDIDLILNESIQDDILDHSKFATLLEQLFYIGLTREQKIEKFYKEFDSHRYFCGCERVDWDSLREKLEALISDISK